jgi:hypothetical protein
MLKRKSRLPIYSFPFRYNFRPYVEVTPNNHLYAGAYPITMPLSLEHNAYPLRGTPLNYDISHPI